MFRPVIRDIDELGRFFAVCLQTRPILIAQLNQSGSGTSLGLLPNIALSALITPSMSAGGWSHAPPLLELPLGVARQPPGLTHWLIGFLELHKKQFHVTLAVESERLHG